MRARRATWLLALGAALVACRGPAEEPACAPALAYPDLDGDGYGAAALGVETCAPPPGWVDRGGDCDDARADVHPGAPETDCADPVDRDCDGRVGFEDADGDGFAACVDCDDGDPDVFPGAEERCDEADRDCDGDPWAGATDASLRYRDRDADGFGDAASAVLTCAREGWVQVAGDCDDRAPAVNPGAEERCDGADDDCDGQVDEDPVDGDPYYADVDGDGFGDPDASVWACALPPGYAAEARDCDDRDRSVFPGAPDRCDGVDDDCSGLADDDPAFHALFFRDADGDGYGDAARGALGCSPPTGHVADESDCDDTRAADHPGADERCDGRDNDCDGAADEADAVDARTWHLDGDGDGHGRAGITALACAAPEGFVRPADDCDDLDARVHPGAPEGECTDPVDYNCDGSVGFADVDGDGFAACVDCDDDDPESWPGAPERCDGVDNDCDADGLVDEGAVDATAWYGDGDGDGFGDPAALVWACEAPDGAVDQAGDCDPTDADVFPGAPERCDGRVNDCGAAPDPAEADGDADGWRVCAGDCRDDLPGVHPGAEDVCDGVDQDCDGSVDEDALGVDPACAAPSCLALAASGRAGPTWVLPADADTPSLVACDHRGPGGGWMRCASVDYTAGVGTVTTDALGAVIGESEPGVGSALGALGTRRVLAACLGLAERELGLGVRWTPEGGAERSVHWRFDAALDPERPAALITPGRGHQCLGVAQVSATPTSTGASEPRWLLLAGGHEAVGCRTGVRSQGRAAGLWTLAMEDADELWLDLSDAQGDAVGRRAGGQGVREDGVLELWVRVAALDTLNPELPPAPAAASVVPLPTRACADHADGLAYTEVAAEIGVDFVAPWADREVPISAQRDRHVGGGLAAVDFTGDDAVDLLLTAPFGAPALYVNDGTGRFTRREDAGLGGVDQPFAAYGVDLDGDGLREAILTSGAGVHVFRNLGGARFQAEPALWTAPPGAQVATLAWTDFDGDGLLDVYVGAGAECFYAPDGRGCQLEDDLLRGRADGSFASIGDRLGLPWDRVGFTLAAGWFDLDRDGDLDLFVANDGGSWHVPNRVFLNPGPGNPEADWAEASAGLGLNAGMAAMGVAFGDVDLDGRSTLVVSDIYDQELFTRGASGPYERQRLASYAGGPMLPGAFPASWAVELEDLDHDRDLDLMVAWGWLLPEAWWDEGMERGAIEGPSPPLANAILERVDGGFVRRDALVAGAPASWGYRTAVPVDLDRDGALDLVSTSAMGPVSVLRAACPAGRWLEVCLEQPAQNRDALGALVELSSGGRTQWRRIGHGSTGTWSGREPAAHFGLGDHAEAHLRVTWPDGRVSELGPVAADQRLRVVRAAD